MCVCVCGGEVGDGEQKRRGIVFDLVSFHVMFFLVLVWVSCIF